MKNGEVSPFSGLTDAIRRFEEAQQSIGELAGFRGAGSRPADAVRINAAQVVYTCQKAGGAK